MDGHCLHSFQQQVLMNGVHISFLLCKYEHLPTAEQIVMFAAIHYDFFSDIHNHLNIWKCSQEEVFSGDTQADTPSWPPL